MLSEQFLTDITCPAKGKKKGWDKTASEYARGVVGRAFGWTGNNLKQIMKREKECVDAMREYIHGMEDVEKTLLEEPSITMPAGWYLSKELSTREQWKEFLRRTISKTLISKTPGSPA